MKIAAVKWADMDTHNLLTTNTTPTQTMNNHRMADHFTAIIKTSETLFDGTPENWPEFEHHLLTEAENPTIRWNQEITNLHPMNGNQNRSTSSKNNLISLKT
jgi:hypothetical protein